MRESVKAVVDEVKKVIVGKDEIIEKVLMVILAGGHILLEDVPGVGKTQLALAFSKAMALKYKRVQFTPDTMASDITGFSVYNKATDAFDYKEGAVLCNLFLADEINRTSAKTQSALLEAMEEQGVTVDGVTHKTPAPFVCIATQNPLGSAGTQKLPDSQLDRFMVKLSMGYPDLASQVDIVKQRQGHDPMEGVVQTVTDIEILEMRKEVANIHIEDDVIQYGASLCEKTREIEEVDQGVSPRAVIALVQMAKARAFISGRNYATPEDIKAVFTDVCAHRLILTAKARIRQETEEKILERVMGGVKVPALLGKTAFVGNKSSVVAGRKTGRSAEKKATSAAGSEAEQITESRAAAPDQITESRAAAPDQITESRAAAADQTAESRAAADDQTAQSKGTAASGVE